MRTRQLLAAGAAILSVILAADECDPPKPQQSAAGSAVDLQRAQASREVATEQTYSYEVDNIKARRVLFGKPGVIGYVVLLNQAGQPVMYTTVRGKCTSAGKRMTRVDEVTYQGNGNGGYNMAVRPALGEDGVYGTSEEYIYCFTTDGRYLQWSGAYLYSDKPFDLTIKPLVIDTSARLSGQ